MAAAMHIEIPAQKTLSWYMPTFYSIVVMILSAMLILSGVLGWKREEKDKIIIDLSAIKHTRQWRVVAFMGMLWVYYICISVIGMVVSTAVFVIAMYLFFGVRSLKTILIGLAIACIAYLAFDIGLNVRFPHGFLY
jgi:hypothetical protein